MTEMGANVQINKRDEFDKKRMFLVEMNGEIFYEFKGIGTLLVLFLVDISYNFGILVEFQLLCEVSNCDFFEKKYKK